MGSSSNQTQQYCLKWNNHQSNLLRVFTRLLGSEQFTDVLLAAEGQTIRAHKVVLSACSSYFEQLFSVYQEKNQIVILKDTNYNDLNAVIEFMYKGEISVVQDQLSSLLKTAESLKVKGLAEVGSSDDKASTGSVEISGKQSEYSVPPSSPQPKNSDGQEVKKSEDVPVNRKRGRPRLLDSPGDVESISTRNSRVKQNKPIIEIPPPPQPQPQDPPLQVPRALLSHSDVTSNDDEEIIEESSPTPGGPLTAQRLSSLGVVKMNVYLQSRTRQQFWDEYFIKVIMQGVRNRELDMKSASEVLGVSYGTLYGRYRETFGYLKHSWNVGGRPPKVPTFFGSDYSDSQARELLEQVRRGQMSMKQAAEILDVEPSILRYQISAKNGDCSEDNEDPMDIEVQPDIILRDEGVDPLEADEEVSQQDK